MKLLPLIFSFFVLTLLIIGQHRPNATQPANRPYVITGHVTEHGWTKEQIEAQQLTHISYAFAIPAETGELAPPKATDSIHLAALTSLKTINKA